MNERFHDAKGRMIDHRIILTIFLSAVLVGSIFAAIGILAPSQKSAFAVGSVTGTADTFAGDNGKIAFVSTGGGGDDIYIMNDDGSSQTRVTINSKFFNRNPVSITDTPVWSPDGNKLLFVTTTRYGDNIYSVNVDGTEQTNLTNLPENDINNQHFAITPQWSPDGTKIVYQGDFLCWLSGQIYVMNADGSDQTNISNSNVAAGQCDVDPHWSPDGSKILFSRVLQTYCPDPSTCIPRLNNQTIFTMNPDGSGQTNVSNNDGSYNDEHPRWSPDSKKIVFDTNRDGNYQIYIMNADGSGQTNISNDGSANDTSPLLSPDGSKILFKRFTTEYAGYMQHCIMLMNSDGSSQTILNCGDATEFIGDPYLLLDTVFAWSPDGTEIAVDGGSHNCLGTNCGGGVVVTDLDNNLIGFTYYTGTLDARPAWGVPAGTAPPPPPPSDTTPPNTFITSALDGDSKIVRNNTKTMSKTINLYFEGTDNIAVTGFECRLDGTTWNSCASPVTYNGLSQSKHYAEVRAIDGAGNKDPTPALFRWTAMTKP